MCVTRNVTSRSESCPSRLGIRWSSKGETTTCWLASDSVGTLPLCTRSWRLWWTPAPSLDVLLHRWVESGAQVGWICDRVLLDRWVRFVAEAPAQVGWICGWGFCTGWLNLWPSAPAQVGWIWCTGGLNLWPSAPTQVSWICGWGSCTGGLNLWLQLLYQ